MNNSNLKQQAEYMTSQYTGKVEINTNIVYSKQCMKRWFINQ